MFDYNLNPNFSDDFNYPSLNRKDLMSLDTIKEHVQNILRKLDVSDRTQAAVWAVRNKLAP